MTRLAALLLAPLVAAPGLAGAVPAHAATVPSAKELLTRALTSLAKQPAVSGRAEISASRRGTVSVHFLVEPAKSATRDEVGFSPGGGVLDVIGLDRTVYFEGNAAGLKFATLGLLPSSALGTLAGKWFSASESTLSSLVAGQEPTISRLGTALCLGRTGLSGLTGNSSTSGMASRCNLEGTSVTSYSPDRVVITSTGLGGERITLAREHGALLPVSVVGLSATSPGSLTFSYPAIAPAISAPATSSPLTGVL